MADRNPWRGLARARVLPRVSGRNETCRQRPFFGRAGLVLLAAMALLETGRLAAGSAIASLDNLFQGFQNPPPEARIMMRWWWFGPAVSEPELERELRAMASGGIGGFEIQPVYPLALDEAASGFRNLPYLSPEFLDRLRFVAQKARELGLRADVTLGSGWPFGGPWIAIDQAASRLRIDKVVAPAGARRIPLPYIDQGERLIAAFLVEPGEPGKSKELPVGNLDAAVYFDPPLGQAAEVWFFISSRTGQQVKRAAVGAEGFVLDHYDEAALRHYLAQVGEPLLRAMGPGNTYAVFCDSLEVYGSDWSQDFLEEFRKRRGYDLRPHLLALARDDWPASRAIRRDWGRTLTELFEERFLKPLADWSRSQGVRLRVQNYGIPPAALGSHRYVELPEGEGWQWKSLSPSRWAASAAHQYGRMIVSSETWTWLHSPSFRATPLDAKVEADMHFLQGINQLIGHGWPYSPPEAGYPGWRFYAAGVFNDQNPWWIVMPELARYLQRVSFLLRQGEPVVDVAVYLPTDDAWADFSPGHAELIRALERRLGTELIRTVLEAGYNLDFFDDETLAERGRVEGRSLSFGGVQYRVVILPAVETMPLATLERLAEFARAGGVLIATGRLPDRVPGFRATQQEHDRLRALVATLFSEATPPGLFVKDVVRQLPEALRSRLQPDLRLDPAIPEIGFVHRRMPGVDLYFVSHTGSTALSVRATFRSSGSHTEVWDPVAGSREQVASWPAKPGGVQLQLELPPFGSRVVVVSSASPAGTSRKPAASNQLLQRIALDGDWTLQVGDRTVKLDKVQPWTAFPEFEFYSGVATYRTSFLLAQGAPQATRVRLLLGEGRPAGQPLEPVRRGQAYQAAWEAPVREAAVVMVNGRRAGAVWCPPYELEITSLVQPGRNTLEIQVANTAMNAMAGRALPAYGLLWLRYGRRFEPQDMDKVAPLPSGLMGPVEIVLEKVEEATSASGR